MTTGAFVWTVLSSACGGDDASGDAEATGSAEGMTATDPSATGESSNTGTTTSATETTTATSDTGGPKFDIPAPDAGDSDTDGPVEVCKVVDDMNAVGDCRESAPPDSFEPVVQWSWDGDGAYVSALPVTPVANLTDDNDDGEIDLCDVPDIVLSLYLPGQYYGPGNMYVLDGATGAMHYQIPDEIAPLSPAAVGDIDNDGIPEIVTAQLSGGGNFGNNGYLAAYEHDGTPKWVGDTETQVVFSSVALADLDNDGDVEIIVGGHVADHNGVGLWTASTGIDILQLTTAADLDGDDDLEVITGSRAYHHDGSMYYDVPTISTGHPQVADLDGDGQPEVLVVTQSGVSMIEHDGTPTFVNQQPLGASSYRRPLAVHDMDGDSEPEIAIGSSNTYAVMETDLTINWMATVLDGSGYASGTAFDFLGAGEAQAMYADETNLYVYDGQGNVLLSAERSSVTQTENPVVADVDNDGSAEIVVISNEGYGEPMPEPPIQVIADIEDRWIQARRIWNQHTYHVTNVREDGTIPQFEPKHWDLLNTFRTQAQIEGGVVCQPDPEG